MILAFVGKGGVGKTTISSAVALSLAERGRTIVVSSDFMSSLRRLFPVDPEGLTVLDLKEKDVTERWKNKYGGEVSSVLKQFIQVDDWILDHVASSPGIADEFLISEIVELDLSGNYDYIVWDTAASSSTMHLLLLEREFYEHLDRDVRIYLRLKDRFRSEKILRLLEKWKKLANDVWNHLLQTKFFLVTTQDELAMDQAEYIGSDLKSMGMDVIARICNRCTETDVQDFQLRLPEIRGSAIEIVNAIRSAGVIDLLRNNEILK